MPMESAQVAGVTGFEYAIGSKCSRTCNI